VAELRPDGWDLNSLAGQEPVEVPAGEDGDVDAALSSASVVVEQTYTTPMEHNNPMEPHTTVAVWEPDPTSAAASAPRACRTRTMCWRRSRPWQWSGVRSSSRSPASRRS